MFYNNEKKIAAGRQRLIKKNWRFSALPLIILVLLVGDLVWEVVRLYMPIGEWPWKFTILGVSTSATLAGVFASLILAREQFARTMRPNLSWVTENAKSEGLEGEAWSVYLLNVGPGLAHVESVKYSVELKNNSYKFSLTNCTLNEIKYGFDKMGLKDGVDYNFRLFSAGAPLPVIKNTSEAVEFASFTMKALDVIRKLDFEVTIIDTLGDSHAKALPFMLTLPAGLVRK